MIDAHVGDVPLTVKEATHCMKEAWARENDCKVVAWNAQLELDRLEQEDRDRLAREDEEAQRVQRKKEAEEQRKEAESKKLKADMFNPKRAVNGTIDPRLATYALNKVSNLEYVELDYFTVRSCREVHLDNYKSINQDTLAFTQLDDTIAIRPMAALRPSKHIRNDEDLSWEEMLAAKNLMLRWMAKSRVWLVTHVESLAEFYMNLEMHERAELDLGKRVLLLYQSWVRREWYDAFKHKEGFNISLIQDKLLCSMAEEVNGNIIFNEIKWICRTADAAFEANTSRHHREHGYRSSSHVRSHLPQRPLHQGSVVVHAPQNMSRYPHQTALKSVSRMGTKVPAGKTQGFFDPAQAHVAEPAQSALAATSTPSQSATGSSCGMDRPARPERTSRAGWSQRMDDPSASIGRCRGDVPP